MVTVGWERCDEMLEGSLPGKIKVVFGLRSARHDKCSVERRQWRYTSYKLLGVRHAQKPVAEDSIGT